MIQTQAELFKKTLIERARVQLLALTNPDPDKQIQTRLLKGLISDSWKETVYEHDTKYFIHLIINKIIPKNEELELMTLIRREFGNDNVICSMIENTSESSSIKVQLKKSNYKEEVLI